MCVCRENRETSLGVLRKLVITLSRSLTLIPFKVRGSEFRKDVEARQVTNLCVRCPRKWLLKITAFSILWTIQPHIHTFWSCFSPSSPVRCSSFISFYWIYILFLAFSVVCKFNDNEDLPLSFPNISMHVEAPL